MKIPIIVGVALTLLSPPSYGQQIPKSHLDLDWNAPNRWVHVDNLDTQKAHLFENARKGWLAVLHQDGRVLGDGRALFWQARTSPAGQTFFSFYPFSKWADLDARREMVIQTEKIVGDSASYHGAPPLQTVLTQQLGQQKSAEIIASLERVFPLKESYEVERRPDLCNLGK